MKATIRILEPESNDRGDLFARLMADVFIGLGYGIARLNIHHAGREVDLTADHRFEKRRVVAECKATAGPTGGDSLNKFAGLLELERSRRSGLRIQGYFISLSGFTETAIEQELAAAEPRFVRLDGPEVVEELVKGRVIISPPRAAELAGRLCGQEPDLVLEEKAELLAHERGWIWAVFYARNKEPTAFVLIHADGTPLGNTIAEEIVASDRACAGHLSALSCLNSRAAAGAGEETASAQAALQAYRRYLGEECGYIHLDGHGQIV